MSGGNGIKLFGTSLVHRHQPRLTTTIHRTQTQESQRTSLDMRKRSRPDQRHQRAEPSVPAPPAFPSTAFVRVYEAQLREPGSSAGPGLLSWAGDEGVLADRYVLCPPRQYLPFLPLSSHGIGCIPLLGLWTWPSPLLSIVHLFIHSVLELSNALSRPPSPYSG